MLPAFSHIRNWIFDLDNTLYAAETNLFALIDERMGQFIAELLDTDRDEAHRIQKSYFYEHGTTLSGLMYHHDVDPHHFLDFVHDIDLDRVSAVPELRQALEALPGRKLIFTNADRFYAQRVLDKLELDDHFEAIHDIHACNYSPKPQEQAYYSMVEALQIDPQESLFVEDMARNLKPAKALGMATVWLNNGSEGGRHAIDHSYIDHEIAALEPWLTSLVEERTNA